MTAGTSLQVENLVWATPAYEALHGISENARAFWSVVNARPVIGYAPEDDSELTHGDGIRAYPVEPARQG